MARILGLYGSPRKGGNSDFLLDRALEACQAAGAFVSRIVVRDLEMTRGCLACYGCEKTGQCVVQDDMQRVYPLLEGSDAIILATPIFFYGVSAQVKALIDRCQCKWCGAILRRTPGQKPPLDRGKGYMIAVGATQGQHMFVGAEWAVRYFYDALDMTYAGGLLVRGVDHKAEILNHPKHLQAAYDLGLKVAQCG